MKREPKKVFMLKNGTYTELTYKKFCKLSAFDSEYQGKKFIMLHRMLIEVTESDYRAFYRDKRRQKYLKERSRKNRDVSLDHPLKNKAGGEYMLEDLLADKTQDVAARVEQKVMLNMLMSCVTILSAEEIYLLYLRYDKELTEKEIGQMFKISQQAISKRLRKILEKLKQLMQK